MTTAFAGAVLDAEGRPFDRIRLTGLRATGHHGVYAQEKVDGQLFSADVVLHLDTRAAARGDDLADTVSYAGVADDVVAVLGGSPADLVETVAERIAAAILTHDAVVAVDVAVHKPQAPLTVPFDDVEVVIRRDRVVVPVVAAPVAAAPVAPIPVGSVAPALIHGVERTTPPATPEPEPALAPSPAVMPPSIPPSTGAAPDPHATDARPTHDAPRAHPDPLAADARPVHDVGAPGPHGHAAQDAGTTAPPAPPVPAPPVPPVDDHETRAPVTEPTYPAAFASTAEGDVVQAEDDEPPTAHEERDPEPLHPADAHVPAEAPYAGEAAGPAVTPEPTGAPTASEVDQDLATGPADGEPVVVVDPTGEPGVPTPPTSAAPGAPGAAEPARPTDRMDDVPAGFVDVVLALGANLGEPQQTLRQAVTDLDRISGLEITEVSPLARTEAVGGPEQPDFLNAVLLARTRLSARDLLHACQAVEHAHGRERTARWNPRTLDVDLIVYGTLTDVADDLELPHPRAHARAFVLEPWSQIDPDAMLPGLGGGPVAALAATAPDRGGIRWLALDWLTEPTPYPTGAVPAVADSSDPSGGPDAYAATGSTPAPGPAPAPAPAPGPVPPPDAVSGPAPRLTTPVFAPPPTSAPEAAPAPRAPRAAQSPQSPPAPPAPEAPEAPEALEGLIRGVPFAPVRTGPSAPGPLADPEIQRPAQTVSRPVFDPVSSHPGDQQR
ncbi:2-amino-4-hydroxy-6-hydroxymethyldihydropteridine diphosphokinase [Cellulosimicrobium arenosum]